MLRIRHFFFEPPSGQSYFWPRWLFLRALGVICLSAFYSLAREMHGLVGSMGIEPVREYLPAVTEAVPRLTRFWMVPTVFWLNASDRAIGIVIGIGLVASVLLIVNILPRVAVALCAVCFLSCLSVLQSFNSYQSDGMLMEALLFSFFFAPKGVRPRLGTLSPPAVVTLFMLRWEWFRIYFESGVAKIASGDPHWRALTAMDKYYETGPLPTWLGWYVQQAPHWYHASTALLTLVVELMLVWLLFAPRPLRIACALGVTALQIGIIATANYAFLNYLVLALGVLLVDDRFLRLPTPTLEPAEFAFPAARSTRFALVGRSVLLVTVFVASLAPFLGSLVSAPAILLDPFRVANRYGLFAVMTPARYEIEFQGTLDGNTWTPYEFRFKRLDPRAAPGIYAPYQPRFEWNLWFASLGSWQSNEWVVATQRRLLDRSPRVLALFRRDPFKGKTPIGVRTVLWRYWFTAPARRRATGRWWEREEIGPYSGLLSRRPDGTLVLTQTP